MDAKRLRPLERRILRLVDAGVDVSEIAHRFRRSPEHIERVIELSRLPGRSAHDSGSGLRALERRVLGWRARGAMPEDIGPRFGRSAAFVTRVEELPHYKLAR